MGCSGGGGMPVAGFVYYYAVILLGALMLRWLLYHQLRSSGGFRMALDFVTTVEAYGCTLGHCRMFRSHCVRGYALAVLTVGIVNAISVSLLPPFLTLLPPPPPGEGGNAPGKQASRSSAGKSSKGGAKEKPSQANVGQPAQDGGQQGYANQGQGGYGQQGKSNNANWPKKANPYRDLQQNPFAGLAGADGPSNTSVQPPYPMSVKAVPYSHYRTSAVNPYGTLEGPDLPAPMNFSQSNANNDEQEYLSEGEPSEVETTPEEALGKTAGEESEVELEQSGGGSGIPLGGENAAPGEVQYNAGEGQPDADGPPYAGGSQAPSNYSQQSYSGQQSPQSHATQNPYQDPQSSMDPNQQPPMTSQQQSAVNQQSGNAPNDDKQNGNSRQNGCRSPPCKPCLPVQPLLEWLPMSCLPTSNPLTHVLKFACGGGGFCNEWALLERVAVHLLAALVAHPLAGALWDSAVCKFYYQSSMFLGGDGWGGDSDSCEWCCDKRFLVPLFIELIGSGVAVLISINSQRPLDQVVVVVQLILIAILSSVDIDFFPIYLNPAIGIMTLLDCDVCDSQLGFTVFIYCVAPTLPILLTRISCRTRQMYDCGGCEADDKKCDEGNEDAENHRDENKPDRKGAMGTDRPKSTINRQPDDRNTKSATSERTAQNKGTEPIGAPGNRGGMQRTQSHISLRQAPPSNTSVAASSGMSKEREIQTIDYDKLFAYTVGSTAAAGVKSQPAGSSTSQKSPSQAAGSSTSRNERENSKISQTKPQVAGSSTSQKPPSQAASNISNKGQKNKGASDSKTNLVGSLQGVTSLKPPEASKLSGANNSKHNAPASLASTHTVDTSIHSTVSQNSPAHKSVIEASNNQPDIIMPSEIIYDRVPSKSNATGWYDAPISQQEPVIASEIIYDKLPPNSNAVKDLHVISNNSNVGSMMPSEITYHEPKQPSKTNAVMDWSSQPNKALLINGGSICGQSESKSSIASDIEGSKNSAIATKSSLAKNPLLIKDGSIHGLIRSKTSNTSNIKGSKKAAISRKSVGYLTG